MPVPVPMSRIAAALGVLLLLPAGLAACGDDDGSGKGLDSVDITGGIGTAPKVVWDGEFDLDESESEVLVEGDGPTVKEGDQVLSHLWIGSDFEQDKAFSTYDQGQAELLTAGKDLATGLREALVGHTIGSRVAVAAPPKDAFGDEGNPQLGIGNKDNVLFIVDLVSDVRAEATGKIAKVPAGTPKIVWKDDKPTGFDFKGAKQPTGQMQILPMITGDGPKVAQGDTVVVNYLGEVYGGKKPFDESYSKGEPAAFRLVEADPKQPSKGGLIKGWVKGLAGQTVGSRVLLQIPPKDGYGEKGQPPDIKGTDTLVFVVEILAAG